MHCYDFQNIVPDKKEQHVTMFSFSDRPSAKEPGVLHGQTDSRVPNTGAIVMCKLILLCLYFFPLPLHQSFAGGRNKNCNQSEGKSLQDNEQDLWTMLQVS